MLRLLLIVLTAGLASPVLAVDQTPAILVLGDSLSAGYGIAREQGWVWLLDERLKSSGYPHRTVNASVSGDTTAGGLTRLPPLLEQHRPAVLMIELGANDGLRGIGFEVIRANLAEIIRRGRAAGSQVLLVGVRLPPNYGAVYTDGFQAMYETVSQTQGVPLVPDLLRGVAENWELMQADGLHPTAVAQPRILDTVWPVLEPLLRTAPESSH